MNACRCGFKSAERGAPGEAGAKRKNQSVGASANCMTPAISMFLAASRTAEKIGGKVIFTGVRGLIADILHRCRLDAILTIATSMDAAMQRARS